MTAKKQIVNQALRMALQVREKGKIPLKDALCVFDFAEANGIAEVRFADIPSLEELYWKNQQKIFVSSLRPYGRQSFNCAHGFGHHIFGHGDCISGVPEKSAKALRFDRNEFLADCFAGFLLMPKTTVCHGFVARGWQVKSCTAVQVYTVAGWLGVGYSTLITHMLTALGMISDSQAEVLIRQKPKQIRADIMGIETNNKLLIVDSCWTGRPIDMEVGDVAVLPSGSVVSGRSVETVSEDGSRVVLRAVTPGVDGRIVCDRIPWQGYVRVSRPEYHGRNLFRHWEDPDHVRD